jgi:hypothetical protein
MRRGSWSFPGSAFPSWSLGTRGKTRHTNQSTLLLDFLFSYKVATMQQSSVGEHNMIFPLVPKLELGNKGKGMVELGNKVEFPESFKISQ